METTTTSEVVQDYYDSLRSESQTARSAFKKGGAPKRYKMPTDKEVKEIMNNATDHSVDPNVFYSYEEFRGLSDEFKKYWMEKQIERFGIGCTQFAKAWGKDVSTVSKYCKSFGMRFKNGLKPKERNINRWFEFVSGENQRGFAEDVAGEEVVKPEKQTCATQYTPQMIPTSASFTMTGVYDELAIGVAMRTFCKDGKSYKITIEIEAV